MRKAGRWVGFSLAAALIAIGGPVAAQSVYGPGGLLLNPTASFPQKGQITPAILVIPTDRPAGDKRTWVSYSLGYGLSEKWEVAATYLKVNPSGGPTFGGAGSAGASAKYRLLEGKPGERPDVAIGGGFLSGGDSDASLGYVAARFSPQREETRNRAYLHAGLMYAGELNGYRRNDWAVYGGADVEITPKLTLFGEIRSEMDAETDAASDLHPPSAIGVVWRPTRGLKLVVAWANNGTSTQHNASVGIGYGIGARR